MEIYRSGHAWVGVSAQLVGIEGREGSLAPLHLKAVNPPRYGESQSAGRLVTFINTVAPLYRPYDGYIVHSRGSRSSALAQEPLAMIETTDAAVSAGFILTDDAQDIIDWAPQQWRSQLMP